MFTKDQWQLIADAVEVLNPDSDKASEMRNEVLRLARYQAEPNSPRKDAAISEARGWATDDLDFDDEPETSESDGPGGVWVAAWVWIQDPDDDATPNE